MLLLCHAVYLIPVKVNLWHASILDLNFVKSVKPQCFFISTLFHSNLNMPCFGFAHYIGIHAMENLCPLLSLFLLLSIKKSLISDYYRMHF